MYNPTPVLNASFQRAYLGLSAVAGLEGVGLRAVTGTRFELELAFEGLRVGGGPGRAEEDELDREVFMSTTVGVIGRAEVRMLGLQSGGKQPRRGRATTRGPHLES